MNNNTSLKSGLQYNISIYKDTIKIIKLTGGFTIQNFSKIEENILSEFKDNSYKMIVLDFENIIFLTSFAIGKIIVFYKLAKEFKITLVLLNLTFQSLNVLKMTKLDSIFNIFNNFDAVINHYKENIGEIIEKKEESFFSAFDKKDFLAYQFYLINVLAPLKYDTEDNISENSDEYKPTVKIVTNSIVQGKLSANIFLEKNIAAEAIKLSDIENELNYHKNIISWVFLEDLIETIDLNNIIKTFDIIRTYEKKHSLIKAPIYFNIPIELDTKTLKIFTSKEIQRLNMTSQELNSQLLFIVFNYLKTRKNLEFFLSDNINITINDENLNIKFINEIRNIDSGYLTKFFNHEIMLKWLDNLFSINIKFHNISDVTEEFIIFFENYYNRYSDKTIIYIGLNEKNLLNKLKNFVDERSINLI